MGEETAGVFTHHGGTDSWRVHSPCGKRQLTCSLTMREENQGRFAIGVPILGWQEEDGVKTQVVCNTSHTQQQQERHNEADLPLPSGFKIHTSQGGSSLSSKV